MGDRVVVMHQGEVRQIGTPADVYDDPADTFVATFLGSPPMNLVEGDDGDHRVPARALPSRRRRARPLSPIDAVSRVSSGPRGVPGLRAHPLRPPRRRPVRRREGGLAAARHVPPRRRVRLPSAFPGRAPQAEVLRPGDGRPARARADRRDDPATARDGGSGPAMLAPAILYVLALVGVPVPPRLRLRRRRREGRQPRVPLRRPRQLRVGAPEPGVPPRRCATRSSSPSAPRSSSSSAGTSWRWS